MRHRVSLPGLPSEQVLVVTHLWWLHRDRKWQLCSFRTYGRLKRGSTPHLEPLAFRLRYISQAIKTRSRYLRPGDYRPFKIIRGNSITLAHSDEPYRQKYGKFVGTRFHKLEHESKMRLLKTQSHTSGRRGYEAGEKRREKREIKEAYQQRTGKTLKKITAISPERGDGGKNCRRKSSKPK